MADRNYSTFGADPNALQNFRATSPANILPFGDLTPSGPKSALDAVVAEYASAPGTSAKQQSTALRLRNLPDRSRPAAVTEDQGSGLDWDYLNSLMYETTGGPNAALLAQLRAGKSTLQRNYEQNKADANNLYGVLSEDEAVPSTGLLGDIQRYGQELQTRYGQSAEEMATAETERRTALETQQAAESERRRQAAASLGLGVENLQAAPSTALDEIMAQSAGAASNWANLLEANRLLAEGSTGRQLAGAQATRANQLIAMKRFLDDQQAQLDAQIAAESSKSPTKSLTAFGKAFEAENVKQMIEQIFPQAPELTPRQQDVANAMTDLGLNPNNPADAARFSTLQEEAVQALKNATITGESISREQMIALEALGVPISYLVPDWASYTGNR